MSRPLTRDLLALLVLLTIGACTSSDGTERTRSIQHEQMLLDLELLSHDSLRGRKVGSPGNAMARQYIERVFAEAGLQAFNGSYLQEFAFVGESRDSIHAANVIGLAPGRRESELVIVVTAHFDHLGVRFGRVFNGADDNASGTAALLELARVFVNVPPEHGIIFVATDAEERGMLGARAFVEDPPVSLDRIALNVNLDMVSHSDSVLYAVGTRAYPFLRSHLEAVAARSGVALRFGHEDPAVGAGDDWTNSSDQAPFNAHGIPYVYFGVEDHDDYHRHTDDFRTINPEFYEMAVETVLDAIHELDLHLDSFPRR